MMLRNRMSENAAPKTGADKQMFEAMTERSGRAKRYIESWSKIPEIGQGLRSMDETAATNTAILLNNQARYLSKLSENQIAANFSGLKTA